GTEPGLQAVRSISFPPRLRAMIPRGGGHLLRHNGVSARAGTTCGGPRRGPPARRHPGAATGARVFSPMHASLAHGYPLHGARLASRRAAEAGIASRQEAPVCAETTREDQAWPSCTTASRRQMASVHVMPAKAG